MLQVPKPAVAHHCVAYGSLGVVISILEMVRLPLSASTTTEYRLPSAAWKIVTSCMTTHVKIFYLSKLGLP